MTQHTIKIAATVGDKALANADAYFVNSPSTKLDELVQNARRAGATHIDFTLKRTLTGFDLTVVDNGRGLPADKAHVLLAFAGSSNDASTERHERAAGVGFFALARHHVEVASRDWTMTIPPAAFVGKDTASLIKGAPHIPGFRVVIHHFQTLSENPSAQELVLATAIKSSVDYSGLAWSLHGCAELDGHHAPKQFLEQHIVDPNVILSDVAETRHGVTMRLLRIQKQYGRQSEINFFGKVLPFDLLKGAEQIACFGNGGHIRSETVVPLVLIDVHDVSTLKLRLPDRNAVIEDDGLEIIKTFARELYIRALAGEGALADHPLSGLNGVSLASPLRQQAIALGLSIDPPSATLKTPDIEWRGAYERPSYLLSPSGAILAPDGDAGTMVDPAVIAVAEGSSDYLASLLAKVDCMRFVTSQSVAGVYGKRHPFAELRGATLHVRAGDEEYACILQDAGLGHLLDLDGETVADTIRTNGTLDDLIDRTVDEIQLGLTFARPDGALFQKFASLKAFWFGEQWDPHVFVARGADVNDVVDSMMDGLFSYSEDGDTWDTQQSACDEEFTTHVTKIVGVTEGVVLADIEQALREVFHRWQDDYFKVSPDLVLRLATVKNDGYLSLAVEKVESP